MVPGSANVGLRLEKSMKFHLREVKRMARLPDPVIEKVKIEPDNEIEDRRKQFFQMVALAIAKAVKKGAASRSEQK